MHETKGEEDTHLYTPSPALLSGKSLDRPTMNELNEFNFHFSKNDLLNAEERNVRYQLKVLLGRKGSVLPSEAHYEGFGDLFSSNLS